jgi:glycosyltransferase involved in cell wall biosynthesis
MRIAFVTPIFPTPHEPFRGAYNFKLVEGLQKCAEVQVFCPRAAAPWQPQRAESLPYTSDRLGSGAGPMPTTYIPYPSLPLVTRPLNGYASSLRLRPFLEDARPDLVFAAWVHPEGYGALRACRRLGIPIVVQALGTDLRRVADPFSRRIVRETMTGADAVVTVSRELKAWAVQYGASPDKVYPVLNGCDAGVFYPRDRAAMRRKLGLPEDCGLAVFVGRLVATKGLRELLDAAISQFPRLPKLRVAVIGDGPMRSEIERRVAESQFGDRFHVIGPRSAWEIAEWLGASDFLCLPSYSEGCPNVVVEALSSGRAVVATNVGGIPELVTDQTGILFPPRDAVALAEALEAALARPWDEARIHRVAGRSWEHAARETYAVCEQTLGR